jgi:hypothetical protein
MSPAMALARRKLSCRSGACGDGRAGKLAAGGAGPRTGSEQLEECEFRGHSAGFPTHFPTGVIQLTDRTPEGGRDFCKQPDPLPCVARSRFDFRSTAGD